MDISGISTAALAATQAQGVDPGVGNLVLKKAMDQEASTAMQLIAAVPAPPSLNTQGPVGTRVNTVA